MGMLIDDLLTFARISRQPLETHPVDPVHIARAALRDLQAETGNGKAQVEIGTLPLATADPSLLKVVMINLLGNALKFTRHQANPRVEVGSLQRGHQTVYFVRDNGVGFDMQYVEKLFGVFQRLHPDKEFEGTGVGLATVQRIIHRHGGDIWAEAKVDEGATFYFTLGDGKHE
jgi:light-regulated signal transduction histidine kinase (bacteriophytochrome)